MLYQSKSSSASARNALSQGHPLAIAHLKISIWPPFAAPTHVSPQGQPCSQPFESVQMPLMCRCRASGFIERTSAFSQPFHHLYIPDYGCLGYGEVIPLTSGLFQPLQLLKISNTCSMPECFLIALTPNLTQPLQGIQMIFLRCCCASRYRPNTRSLSTTSAPPSGLRVLPSTGTNFLLTRTHFPSTTSSFQLDPLPQHSGLSPFLLDISSKSTTLVKTTIPLQPSCWRFSPALLGGLWQTKKAGRGGCQADLNASQLWQTKGSTIWVTSSFVTAVSRINNSTSIGRSCHPSVPRLSSSIHQRYKISWSSNLFMKAELSS